MGILDAFGVTAERADLHRPSPRPVVVKPPYYVAD